MAGSHAFMINAMKKVEEDVGSAPWYAQAGQPVVEAVDKEPFPGRPCNYRHVSICSRYPDLCAQRSKRGEAQRRMYGGVVAWR